MSTSVQRMLRRTAAAVATLVLAFGLLFAVAVRAPRATPVSSTRPAMASITLAGLPSFCIWMICFN